MTKTTKTYLTCAETRKKIDKLLHANAAYQAQNTCENNSIAQKKEVNRYCNREFLYPIREIDPAFYESIKIQSD
jgi:hypothetical protein|tara:strand:- start:1494 stop:1715 length:222 start_codon:yes stop_codon:yes gene_type:complete